MTQGEQYSLLPRESFRLLPRLLSLLSILLAGMIPANQGWGHVAGSAAAAKSGTVGRTSDQTADALLTALKAEQFEAAYALFDSTMKAALPVEKLKAVWAGQLASFGSLKSWTITQRMEAQGHDIRIAILQFEQGQLQGTIAVKAESQEIGGFFIKPYTATPPVATPAPYVDPSKFRALEMTVGAAPYVLGATLTVPIGAGPFPGVVLVHGSGPNDRDETIGGNKIFKDLAEGLSSRGIAVLRYDKRTYQYGTKLSKDISVDDEAILDAIAAVKLLAGSPAVNPARVFVVGHSMGAQLAPEIAVRSGAAAGVALLAPPGRPPWDIVLAQFQYLQVPKDQMDEAEQKVAKIKAGTLGDEPFLGAPQSYWKDLAAHDGVAMAKKLGKPVLILRGERDYQVTDEDIAIWRTGLAGMPHVEIDTLPKLNHLFIAGSGKPGPAEYTTPGHVDAGVIDKLAAFLAPAK